MGKTAPTRTPQLVVTVVDEHGPIELTVRALTPAEYDRLAAAYPDPAGVDPFDEEVFGPALIGASLVPPVAEEEVAVWWRTWPIDAIGDLFTAAMDLSSPGDVDAHIARLRADTRFAAEMAYCGPNGIPHETFLGWSRTAQDKAIAWQVTKDDACPGCGVPTRFMLDPLAAHVEQRECVHCQELTIRTDALPDEVRPYIHSHVALGAPPEEYLP